MQNEPDAAEEVSGPQRVMHFVAQPSGIFSLLFVYVFGTARWLSF
jgi:hypothetical protein